MINRELIRIKAVQLTYAYFQNGNHNLDNAEKELMFSLTKAYHLYNTLLLLIVAVTRMARKHYDIASAKAEREGFTGPSARFAFNKFAVQLEENKQLKEFVEDQKNLWDDKAEFVKNLYLQMEQSETYQEFIASSDDDYETHREVWRKLYKLFIQNNDDLSLTLEEDSIYWNDDKEVVDTFVLKTIKRFEPSNGADQELLPEFRDYEDKEFAQTLLRKSIDNCQYYQSLISKSVKNWEFDRLAFMDVILMQMALAEMFSFSEIPVSVTINEYIEMAKYYSTPKSHKYINGILDNVSKRLIKEHKLMKK